jgi:allantoinase
MHEIAAFGGLLVVHAEDPAYVSAAPSSTAYSDFLVSRPRDAEAAAVELVVELARASGCRAHVVHVSSAEALPLIAGTEVTAETCPHYLTLAAEDIGDGATQFKCCPPIREDANRDHLWRGLRDGVIGLVVSDHSPSTVELKRLDSGDFAAAWGGIASLQLGLPVVWTEARRRGFTLADVASWMSAGPAALVGLRRKGAIEVGRDADLVVFAPEDTWVVDVHRLHHRNPLTPYDGRTMTGAVRRTWLRGVQVDLDAGPHGRLLRRGAA